MSGGVVGVRVGVVVVGGVGCVGVVVGGVVSVVVVVVTVRGVGVVRCGWALLSGLPVFVSVSSVLVLALMVDVGVVVGVNGCVCGGDVVVVVRVCGVDVGVAGVGVRGCWWCGRRCRRCRCC